MGGPLLPKDVEERPHCHVVQVWDVRPLTQSMLDFAVRGVAHLQELYDEMLHRCKTLDGPVQKLTDMYLLLYADSQLYGPQESDMSRVIVQWMKDARRDWAQEEADKKPRAKRKKNKKPHPAANGPAEDGPKDLADAAPAALEMKGVDVAWVDCWTLVACLAYRLRET